MYYVPLMIYTSKTQFWPVIDNALRAAAIERNIHVRLLVSRPKDPKERTHDSFLRSLEDFSNNYENAKIEVAST